MEMKNLAFLLFCAVIAQTNARGVHPPVCSWNGSIITLFPHPNCHKFYQCWFGALFVRTCPPFFHFSVEYNRCVWQSLSDCRDRDIPEVSEPEIDVDSSNEDNGNYNPSEAPSICAREGSDGILVAHENCNKYFICNHGEPLAQRCPANLFFNPKKDECDWPENVDCINVIPYKTEEDQDDQYNKENGNDANVGAGNSDPSKAPSICASKNSTGVLVAHENCTEYYICDHGKPVAQRCPDNLYFNPKKDQCDWPSNVDCRSSVIFVCSADNSTGVPVPHEECNKYYICVHGISVALRCPANLLFNPKKYECDWPRNVDCKGRFIPGSSKDTKEDLNGKINNKISNNGNVGAGNSDPSKALYICALKNSSGVLVAHEKCNEYYICDHGKPVAQRCPPNLFFNPKKDECDWPENVDCRDSPTSICAAQNSTGVLVAHEKCNKYYICVHGKPVALRCPGYLLFNPKNNECDWPRNVNCRGRVIPGSEENTKEDQKHQVRNEISNDLSDDSNVRSGNSNPSKAPYICAEKNSTGVLVAHENCNKYYICDNGKPVVQRCPFNLFFNPKIDECDWPKNVDCRHRYIEV